MDKQIHNEIMEIEDKGLSNVEILALVTDTSYEVVFYAKYNNKMRQGNDLVEDGILAHDFVDRTYSTVAKAIRMDEKYVFGKMNIVKASKENITIEYDKKACRTYKVKKSWKATLGV